ncbi:MAG: RnfABCDGE type electron transport complex subunit D [Acidobacteriota bacterium]|nr:RnfABCDGE type electron transport complex subunit D [Acidobacteriota bacterium]
MTPGRLFDPRDPRDFQIAVLTGLLGYGILALDFEVDALTSGTIISISLLTQAACSRWFALPRFDPKSPLISALSLCLLLRTDDPWVAALSGAIAVGSKFLIRWRGKHLFNPSAFALVVLIVLTDRAWVSAGQWGSAALFAYLVAGMGGLVVHRAARSDVTLAFLMSAAALLFTRALWLGDPLTIPWHQLQSGSLLLFAFHMISDPKTTPDSRAGRIVFAALVALCGTFVQFGLFRQNGLLYALIAAGTVVPLIDRLLPVRRYRRTAAVRSAMWHGLGPTSVRAPLTIPSTLNDRRLT